VAFTLLALFSGVLAISALLEPRYWVWGLRHLMLVPQTDPSLFHHFGSGSLNGSLWTIPAEFSFYLAVPLIFRIEQKYGFATMLAVLAGSILGFIALQRVLFVPAPDSLPARLSMITFLPYFSFFALGIFWSRQWPRVYKGWPLAALSLAVFMALRTFDVTGSAAHVRETFKGYNLALEPALQPLYFFTWSLALSYVVLWVGYFGPRVLRVLPQKIGDLSYGVYIWHMIIVNFAVHFAWSQRLAGPGAAQLAIFLSCGILAALSWNFVEKPALRWKPYSSRSAGDNER
jgi:peptidoglycan/LPS O-acetylase OafA/YrhL